MSIKGSALATYLPKDLKNNPLSRISGKVIIIPLANNSNGIPGFDFMVFLNRRIALVALLSHLICRCKMEFAPLKPPLSFFLVRHLKPNVCMARFIQLAPARQILSP
jgi:hypothetical protein